MSSESAIFLEALWDASIIPYGNQNTFSAVTTFDPAAATQTIIFAVCGSAAGYIINWFVGRWMATHSLSKQNPATQAHFAKIQPIVQKYAWLALLLVWVPLGNYITLLAGFFKVKLEVMLAVSIPFIAAYYAYQAGMF